MHIITVSLFKTLDTNMKLMNASPRGIFVRAYFKNALSFEEARIFANFVFKAQQKTIDEENSNTNCKVFYEEIIKTLLTYFHSKHRTKKIFTNQNLALLIFGSINDQLQEENNFLHTLSR